MKSNIIIVLCAFIILILSCNKDEQSSLDPIPDVSGQGWKLIWSDEFNEAEINTNNWVHEIGDGTFYGDNPGWGNNQKQLYTDDPTNSYIAVDEKGNSVLVIEAVKNGTNPDYPYTSARMTTEGLQSFRYGKIEARIKLPYSKGIWPAFWMMGINKPDCGWPGCGEIDIIEMLGNQEEKVTGNVHYIDAEGRHNEDLGASVIASGKYSDDYHLYTIIWTSDSINWFVDEKMYHVKAIGDDMLEFTRSHYLLLNVAVGGYWPGYPDETSVFPQKLLVDYIRVYKDTTTVIDPEIVNFPCEVMSGGVNDATIAIHAVNRNFIPFQDIKAVSYGPGIMPEVSKSIYAIDGEYSVLALFPGKNWGGVWFELTKPIDMSAYSSGNLVVSLIIPPNIVNFEIKLESIGGAASLNLLDYNPVPQGKGFMQYTIPLSDFIDLGLKIDKLKIPFALWNPLDAGNNYVAGDVLIDKLYFE